MKTCGRIQSLQSQIESFFVARLPCHKYYEASKYTSYRNAWESTQD
jgi:hypothetical protein